MEEDPNFAAAIGATVADNPASFTLQGAVNDGKRNDDELRDQNSGAGDGEIARGDDDDDGKHDEHDNDGGKHDEHGGEHDDDDDDDDESENEEDQDESRIPYKRQRKESEQQAKARKFWAKRGLVKYGREWQTYSKSYMKEVVRHVQSLKGKEFSKVRKECYERLTTTTFSIARTHEENVSKYLHLKSADNDIAQAIESYLDRRECGLIYGARSKGNLSNFESLLSVIDDVPDWFTVENFRDEVINYLYLQAGELIKSLLPQLLYAGFSYKELVQRLYDGSPMGSGLDFYMVAARHFLALPILVIKPKFNTRKKKEAGGPEYVFHKEYFYEPDSYLGDDLIRLKFIFNGCNYYAPYLQEDATRIVRVGLPVFRGVTHAFNNLTDLMDSIPPRSSLNSGLRKLILYLKAASNIVKGTKLTAGYSEAAEIKMVHIPGVDPLSEATIRRKKRKASATVTSTEKAQETVTAEADSTHTETSAESGNQQQQQQQQAPSTSTGSEDTSDKLKPKEDFDHAAMAEFQCVCGFQADDDHALRVHKKNQHPRHYFRCWGFLKSTTNGEERRCPHETDDEGSAWRHYRTRHLGIYYCQCGVKGCTYQADSADGVAHHMATKHGAPAKLLCPVCNKYVARAQYLSKRHMQSCTTKDKKIKFYTCDVCHKGFRDHDTFSSHKVRLHSKIPGSTTGWYYCGECEKRFSTNSSRKRHIREKHTGAEQPIPVQEQDTAVDENEQETLVE